MNREDASALMAEFIGTFALTFVGILAPQANRLVGEAPGGPVADALAPACILAVMIGTLSPISKAHFNPVVTVGIFALRRMPGGLALGYLLAQFGGAIAAAFLLLGMFGAALVRAGTPMVADRITVGQGLLLESIGTFFLVLVIVSGAVDKRANSTLLPMLVGMVVAADNLAIGPLTGAAMNPARALGPALASGGCDAVTAKLTQSHHFC
jgi:aquaporin Z